MNGEYGYIDYLMMHQFLSLVTCVGRMRELRLEDINAEIV